MNPMVESVNNHKQSPKRSNSREDRELRPRKPAHRGGSNEFPFGKRHPGRCELLVFGSVNWGNRLV